MNGEHRINLQAFLSLSFVTFTDVISWCCPESFTMSSRIKRSILAFWSDWENQGTCTASCGGGTVHKQRYCMFKDSSIEQKFCDGEVASGGFMATVHSLLEVWPMTDIDDCNTQTCGMLIENIH